MKKHLSTIFATIITVQEVAKDSIKNLTAKERFYYFLTNPATINNGLVVVPQYSWKFWS
jgi:hypothetical protein